MAQLNSDSLFQSWILSPEEFIQGSFLNSLQKQVIQNQISQLASERVMLTFDPVNHLPFMQRDAELKGQIGALQYLLNLSSEAEKQFDPGAQKIVIQTPLDQ